MARTRSSRRRPTAAAQANPQANPLQLLSQKGAKKQAQAAKKQAPRNVNVPTYSGGTGVKRMRLNKRQTAKWKIKRLALPPRNISVKKRGTVVRKMIVRRNAIYPEITGGNY